MITVKVNVICKGAVSENCIEVEYEDNGITQYVGVSDASEYVEGKTYHLKLLVRGCSSMGWYVSTRDDDVLYNPWTILFIVIDLGLFVAMAGCAMISHEMYNRYKKQLQEQLK